MGSILNDIKQMIAGLTPDDTSFDVDIIAHINTVFFILNEYGIGPITPFLITDATATWDDFFDVQPQFPKSKNIEVIKTYMCTRVRLMFDPPASSTVIEVYNHIIDELEYRMLLTCDDIDGSE